MRQMDPTRTTALDGARKLATGTLVASKAKKRAGFMALVKKPRMFGTLLAVGVASATMIFGSYAAWSDQTTNPGNSVTAGTLDMTNDKDAAAIISAVDVLPGDTGSGTVVITNAGDVPFQAFLTQSGVTSVGIETNLRLSIHDDTRDWCYYPASGAGACAALAAWDGTATLNNLQIMNTAGAALWPVAEAHTFTVSWELVSASGAADMAQTGAFDLTWDATQ